MQDQYWLSTGPHADPKNGRCANEWVSYLANEPHSASPECMCPVLSEFCVAFNDDLPDDPRQKLRRYLARTIGTRGDGLAEMRAWMCMDWLIRTYTPVWLSLAGLDDAAERVRLLPPLLGAENLERAIGDLKAATREAAAASDAACDAIGGATACDATWGALRATAWDAAWDAARGVGYATWAIACDAARGIGLAAVRATAWTAAGDASAALAPTVDELQRSAFDLLDRMLPLEPIQLPVAEDADRVCALVGDAL